jgi:hypothetical protein
MDEILERFRRESEELSDRLLADATEGRDRESREQDRESSPETWGFSDIEYSLRRLHEQAENYAEAGVMFPVVSVEAERNESDLIPIDVPTCSAHLGANSHHHGFPFGPFGYRSSWVHDAYEMAGGMLPNAKIRGVPPRLITKLLRRPLVQFVANRLFGRNTLPATSTAPFELECRRSGSPLFGVNAHYTPAFVISLGKFGSVLTTPVKSSLPPGHYHFGADSPGSSSAAMDWNIRFNIPINKTGTINV